METPAKLFQETSISSLRKQIKDFGTIISSPKLSLSEALLEIEALNRLKNDCNFVVILVERTVLEKDRNIQDLQEMLTAVEEEKFVGHETGHEKSQFHDLFKPNESIDLSEPSVDNSLALKQKSYKVTKELGSYIAFMEEQVKKPLFGGAGEDKHFGSMVRKSQEILNTLNTLLNHSVEPSPFVETDEKVKIVLDL